MYRQLALFTTSKFLPANPIESNRMHHCYRPTKYCDWYKPENEFYYEPICQPCEKPCKPCLPAVVCEKQCKVCSFWQQAKDNCCQLFWPLPPMPMRTEARIYICKDLRRKNVDDKEAKRRLNVRTFPLHDCDEIPECPEPNWEARRPPEYL